MLNLLVTAGLLTCLAAAQPGEEFGTRGPGFNEGKMFTIRFTPGEKKIVVGIVGKPTLEAGPDRIALVAREVQQSGKQKPLTIAPAGEGFQIQSDLDPKASIEVEVEDRTTRKKEVLRLRQSPKP